MFIKHTLKEIVYIAFVKIEIKDQDFEGLRSGLTQKELFMEDLL